MSKMISLKEAREILEAVVQAENLSPCELVVKTYDDGSPAYCLHVIQRRQRKFLFFKWTKRVSVESWYTNSLENFLYRFKEDVHQVKDKRRLQEQEAERMRKHFQEYVANHTFDKVLSK